MRQKSATQFSGVPRVSKSISSAGTMIIVDRDRRDDGSEAFWKPQVLNLHLLHVTLLRHAKTAS